MKLSRNHTVLGSCIVVVAGMLGLSYAAVPLYDMFCRVTGYGGTPARADAAPLEATAQRVTIRFDANVDPALPWAFQPDQRAIDVNIGENKLTFFTAENRGEEAVVGHATFNVIPERAARYFAKISCFCFTEQRLEPGQSIDMPVSFFVDPAILDDREVGGIGEITLSYTFFRSATGNTASVTDAEGEG
jgi:cytochrome c oxidase assembly protein subunit 11